MSFWVRGFVGCVFAALGLSFLVTSGVLVWEFWDAGWLTIASFYSHLFLFFPTFGIVTLCAFYMPACVFTDMYLRFVPLGAVRFVFGFVAATLLSIGGADMLTGSQERSIFEVRPDLLVAERGEPPDCAATGACERLPILRAIDNVRRVSQTRIGLADLARNCRPDALKDALPGAAPARRYCFASTPLPDDIDKVTSVQRTTDAECCRAQERFTRAVRDLHDQPDGRSLTARVHRASLPFKIFFALVLLVISIMLAVRRIPMETHYGRYLSGIERGVLVGAVAMVVFPVMSHAFLQSAALLYHGGGPTGGYRSTAPAFSFALGAWGLLLLFFFYGRQNERMQNLARIGGMIGSAVAVIKYEQIIDICVRGFGSGAGLLNIVLLGLAAVASLGLLVTWTTKELDDPEPAAAAAAGETAATAGPPDRR